MLRSSVFFIVMLALASCSALLGIKKTKKLDWYAMQKYAKQYHIPDSVSYALDTARYRKFVNGISNPYLKKDVQQPLQVKVFDANGKMMFWLVNCYIGGFPNLKWDRYGTFDVFPPDKKYFKSVDTTFTLEKDQQFYFYHSPQRNLQPTINKGMDLYIVVYWARFMDRHSRHLIRMINDYRQKFADRKIEVVYVNDNNWY
ncbi:MAG TPA: hypothetical protein VI112_12880 [Bacteroidia bacterium]